jgi:hypothetical protein
VETSAISKEMAFWRTRLGATGPRRNKFSSAARVVIRFRTNNCGLNKWFWFWNSLFVPLFLKNNQ